MTNQGIVWLASYPKSGNTWFRIVLAHLLNETNQSINLDQINIGINCASRSFINQILGFNSTLLGHQELAKLRPSLYQWYGNCQQHKYLKIHDAYCTPDESPVIPREHCFGIVYLVRNPLDVAISFAHHINFSIDQAIEFMGEKKFNFFESNQKATPQVRQLLSSWSLHVKSWALECDLDVLSLRYEDISLNALDTFSQAVQFLKLDYSTEKIQEAIALSQFEKLQKMEQQFGFSERSAAQPGLFFRKGIMGDWENTLTQSQIKRIIHDHGEMMQFYGYLDHQYRPIRSKDLLYNSLGLNSIKGT